MVGSPADEAPLGQLLECERPYLIGVRHHSAALSRCVPTLLDAFRPDCVLVELPAEFASWLTWLGHEELAAPVALAGAFDHREGLSFFPFADFSPELAAVRWAFRHGVPVQPCDLPMAHQGGAQPRVHQDCRPDGLLAHIFRQTQTTEAGGLWERLVETPSAGADPESVRRAALLFGWALRCNDEEASCRDRLREGYMRACIEKAGGGCAVVAGAYHAPALLPEPLLWSPVEETEDERAGDEAAAGSPTTALIPYSFEQLDERSGYPAGIRDPEWHQNTWAARSPAEVERTVADLTVRVCRELRAAGHPVNAADGKEVLRFAVDLSRLRRLPAPGRGELIEALQTCLTQGELMGIGRAVAQAMEKVLVGSKAGRLPPGTPRSGLGPHIERLLEQLQLPGPATLGQSKRLRLDPLRSRLDRARVVTFERLQTCGIPYATPIRSEDDSVRENLTEVWEVEWQHATAALLELKAAGGATLVQATVGALSSEEPEDEDEKWAAEHLSRLECAARCGLSELVKQGLAELMGPYLLSAGLSELTLAMQFVERVRTGHIPGLPLSEEDARAPFVQLFQVPPDVHTAPLLQAAIGRLDGLHGSEDLDDVVGLLDLVLWFQQQEDHPSDLDPGRLTWCLRKMAREGSALMQGAGLGALVLLGLQDSHEFGRALGSWADAAVDRSSRGLLLARITGAVLMASPRLEADLSCLDEFESRVGALSDADFLGRLPALRGGFSVLPPAARYQLLRELLTRLPEAAESTSGDIEAPELAASRFEADEVGRKAVAALMPGLALTEALRDAGRPSRPFRPAEEGVRLPLPDRWRLILASETDRLPEEGRCAARALDELYGRGAEGRCQGGLGLGGGRERPYPDVREWAGELESLFGEDVREEVLGQAASQGRAAALTALDPETVTPSVELLEQVLSLKGALPQSQLETLRKLARRIVDQLVVELSTRLRPALSGLTTPRPTRRPTPRLDLNRTVRANLQTARASADGGVILVPERLIFRSLSRRSMDWHLIFVVDVSGSMEASVIYSAMMAAIFSALPALSVEFLAFSTEVIDFSDRISDPLAVLLEVEVGGGTHIAKGLRSARQRMRVPARTIVLLVTDFEEGWPPAGLFAEVRALVETGAKGLGLAALNDEGQPRYNKGLAEQVASCGMPVAALSPSELARWVGEQIR